LIEPGRLLSGATYLDPTGRYVASFGVPWRRAVAAAIDWTLCYVGFVVVSIPLGAVEGLGAVSREEGDLGGLPGHVLVVATQVLTVVPVIAYFGLLLPTSHTYGMRALGLRIVSVRAGRAPSHTAAIIRGVVATAVAASFYVSYLVWSSFEKPHGLDDASSYALAVAHVLVVVGGGSALMMILTPTHRSLVDRVFGTAVLDNVEAVAPRMGPWGPLDSFDLSSREG